MQPLPLPENFNPETFMLSKITENGVFHESRQGASFAARLVANGTPQDLELAHKVLDVVLRVQERHSDDPHYGNFMWMIEDTVVQDLNAVEFNLEHLIPMMLQHAERLSPEMQGRVLDAICLGLDEIRRLDVLPVYTNITLLDILNTCLGGELLGDAAIAQRGYTKLVMWMALTDQHGHPFEYNSPTYGAVDIRALGRLAALVQHADTRIRARTALARLGLSAALHIHAATGRWAGPHSRAYQPSVVCETEAEVAMLDSLEDRKAFLESAGLADTGLSRLIRAAYSLLGLRTFFTENGKELRAWTYREGAKAPETAGIVHTDMERGFIKAETYRCDDLFELGTVDAVRKAGKLRTEGRDYVVQDGDVMLFKFNV